MRVSIVALILPVILSVVSQSAAQEDRRSFGLLDRLPDEDPSCDFVNRSYERTFGGNFAYRLYGVQPAGAFDLLEIRVFIGDFAYDRQGLGRWHLRHRGLRKTVDGIGAVFRHCSNASDSLYGAAPVKVFQVDWARNGYNAKSEVMISTATSKIIKTTRQFVGATPTGFPVMTEIFETKRDRIKAPSDAVDLRNE
ncbi:hypothetical protein [Rhizobium indigoferae]|uniref:Uncharacterized protein n=1 Tax=Rhizobium indigoferae TaxID=158891 RepID=A0ABZ1DTF0_9HYPH|nr:hypothetical protein [Rhizobium indigoferae]NNU53260.1 hypothetical protein [Rhizobium indigoferae]WRW39464.1 hypothetical protein U5G49_004803 [Rhizobium indigoferae]